MERFLTLAYLFFIGSIAGWCMEVVFRRHFSPANPEKKWINPGFCTGPYLPIYGFGLCVLYLVAELEGHLLIAGAFWRKALVLLVMGLSMTAIEYVAGILCLKLAKVRLWDYSDCRGNIQGIICPAFSAMWTALGAFYYFLLHPWVKSILERLHDNPGSSFFVGIFFGVFLVDVANSAQLVVKLRAWARENNMVVRYEALKAHIRRRTDQQKLKYRFCLPFRTDRPITEHLREMREGLEQRLRRD